MELSNPIIAYAAVFFGGLIASFSPCSIAVIPLIIGYVGGYAEGDIKKSILFAAFFSLGLAITFTCLGIFAAITGNLLGGGGGGWKYLLGAISIVMGAQMVGILKVNLPVFSAPKNSPKGMVGAFFLGLLYGLAASPCATPILALVLAYVASEQNIIYGASLLLVYSLANASVVFILGLTAGITGGILKTKRAGDAINLLHRGAGLVIIITGILILIGIIR